MAAVPSVARIAQSYALVALALPAFIVPFSGIAPDAQKNVFIALALGVCMIIVALRVALSSVEIHVPRSLLLLVALPLFVVVLISGFGFVSPHAALWGTAFEFGSIGSFTLILLSIAAGSFLTAGSFRVIRHVFPIASLIGAAVSLIGISTGITGGSDMLMGSRESLAPVLATAAAFAAILADTNEGGEQTWFYSYLALILAATLVFSLQAVAWVAALFLGIMAALWFVPRPRRIPWGTLAAACVFFFLAISGWHPPLASTAREDIVPLSSQVIVLGSVYIDDFRKALIGGGPLSYERTWELYRGADVARLPVGTGAPSAPTIIQIALMFGIIGVAAFFLIPLSLMISLALSNSVTSVTRRNSLGFFTLAFLPFLTAFFIDVPLSLFIAAGVGVGMFAASTERAQSWRFAGWRWDTIATAVAIGICGCMVAGVAVRQYAAAELNAWGRRMAAVDPAHAASVLPLAAGVWNVSAYDRDAVLALLARAQVESQTQAKNGISDPAVIQSLIKRAVTFAEKGTEADRFDPEAWLFKAYTYYEISSTGYEGALEDAARSLQVAQQWLPQRADAYYAAALIASAQNDATRANASLVRALQLQPDYPEAKRLLEQLDAR